MPPRGLCHPYCRFCYCCCCCGIIVMIVVFCAGFFFSPVPSGPSGVSGRALWARPCDVIARRMQFLRIPSSYKTFLQLIKHYYSYRKISISSWNPQKILFLACDAVARRNKLLLRSRIHELESCWAVGSCPASDPTARPWRKQT